MEHVLRLLLSPLVPILAMSMAGAAIGAYLAVRFALGKGDRGGGSARPPGPVREAMRRVRKRYLHIEAVFDDWISTEEEDLGPRDQAQDGASGPQAVTPPPVQ